MPEPGNGRIQESKRPVILGFFDSWVHAFRERPPKECRNPGMEESKNPKQRAPEWALSVRNPSVVNDDDESSPTVATAIATATTTATAAAAAALARTRNVHLDRAALDHLAIEARD